MPRYKLTIEYDGSRFFGWQRQPHAPSIQETIEAALEQFCGEKIDVHGAGRTDAGVHARGQTAHIDLPKTYPLFNIQQGINFYLGENAIAIVNAEEVPDDFHARFSATRRHYLYRIINRSARLALDDNRTWHVPEKLDAAAMHEAAQHLVGHYDFSTFRDTECQAASPVKTLDRLDVERDGDEIRIYTNARSYLHHQVRNMAGSLRKVGNGKWSIEDFIAARDAKDRRAGGETAQPQGLFLMQVDY